MRQTSRAGGSKAKTNGACVGKRFAGFIVSSLRPVGPNLSARWVRSNLASGSSGPHPSWVSVRTRIETRPFIPLIKRQSTSPALGTIRREAIHHISFKTFLRRLHLGGLRSSFITNMPSYYDEMLAVLKNNRHGKLLLQNAAGESAKILALTWPNRTGGPRWGTKSF
jgi:hypothetical protein